MIALMGSDEESGLRYGSVSPTRHDDGGTARRR